MNLFETIKQTNKMKNTITLLIIGLITFSCGSKEEHHIVKLAPINVTISKVNTDTNTANFINVSGTIQAENSANISTRMMGYVKKVNVKVGSKVRKGQLLVAISNADLQAKLAQVNANVNKAQVSVQSAKKDFSRFTTLFAQESVSQKEMDDMTMHYEMAKSGLEAANQMKNEVNAQFAYTNLKAPFSGVVTGKFVEIGDMANPGVPLISIESPNNFEVIAMVPESEISKIKNDDKVTILIKSLNETITGKVSEIGVSAKNTGGQYLVKISIDKSKVKLFSGMFTTVQFTIKNNDKVKSNKVLIPIKSLVEKGSLKGIYTVSEQNTALLRWLRLGKTYGDKIEVLSGLTFGETYITSTEAKLYNGAPLKIK